MWVLCNYHSTEPIILSVGEEDEVSIADVARYIADAMDFRGKHITFSSELVVSSFHGVSVDVDV